MGSISGISKKDVILTLIKNKINDLDNKNLRINDESEDIYDGLSNELKDDTDIIKRNTTIRLFESDEIKKIDNILADNKIIFYTTNRVAQEKANRKHKNTLTYLRRFFERNNQISQDTTHIDLFTINKNILLLFEAKSINSKIELKQIRQALGQLFEYEYYEIREILLKKQYKHISSIIKCLIFSQKPSNIKYLESLQNQRIYSYWIDNEELKGLDKSIEILNNFLDQ